MLLSIKQIGKFIKNLRHDHGFDVEIVAKGAGFEVYKVLKVDGKNVKDLLFEL